MRSLIMEELDSGIPEAVASQTVESESTTTTSAPSAKATTSTSTGGSSKYAQMLAKAKAEEAARTD